MLHMATNKVFHIIHQRPLHGKTITEKNKLVFGWGVHNISQSPVDGKVYGLLTNLTLATPVLDVFRNVTPKSQHERNQFRSKSSGVSTFVV